MSVSLYNFLLIMKNWVAFIGFLLLMKRPIISYITF